MLDMLEEVVKDAGFSNLVSINSEQDVGFMNFTEDTVLSPQDESTLDSLVAAFDDQSLREKINGTWVGIQNTPIDVRNTDWTCVCQWVYPGRANKPLSSISITAHQVVAAPSEQFHVRLYDVVQHKELWSTTGSNATPDTQTVRLPMTAYTTLESTLEVHTKTTNSSIPVRITNVSAITQ